MWFSQKIFTNLFFDKEAHEDDAIFWPRLYINIFRFSIYIIDLLEGEIKTSYVNYAGNSCITSRHVEFRLTCWSWREDRSQIINNLISRYNWWLDVSPGNELLLQKKTPTYVPFIQLGICINKLWAGDLTNFQDFSNSYKRIDRMPLK